MEVGIDGRAVKRTVERGGSASWDMAGNFRKGGGQRGERLRGKRREADGAMGSDSDVVEDGGERAEGWG